MSTGFKRGDPTGSWKTTTTAGSKTDLNTSPPTNQIESRVEASKTLEDFPTEKTKHYVKQKTLPKKLELSMENVDKNSMLYVYNKIRVENPSVLNLMCVDQENIDHESLSRDQ